MNGSLRSILSLAIMIAILVIIIRFVSFMLPYVLIAALIIFIYRKIKGTLDYKKEKHEQGSVYTTKPSEEESPFDSEDGEIIDVDAYTGGFNLQIAYSTGYTAGKIN